MKTYYDNFQNKATITKVRIKPYCDAKQKQTGYLLKCYAMYDRNFMYSANLFETEQDALQELQKYSCGTFVEKVD